MKVRLKISRVGNRLVQNAGEIVDVSPAEAKRMIAAGTAEPVDAQPGIETAMVDATGREVHPCRRRKSRMRM